MKPLTIFVCLLAWVTVSDAAFAQLPPPMPPPAPARLAPPTVRPAPPAPPLGTPITGRASTYYYDDSHMIITPTPVGILTIGATTRRQVAAQIRNGDALDALQPGGRDIGASRRVGARQPQWTMGAPGIGERK
jgi:hypothetical protein